MGYVRIIIHLRDGSKRSGVRSFTEPIVLQDIRMHAWHLAGESLGRAAIEDLSVQEVGPDDPAVVALILKEMKRKKGIAPSDGEHPLY